METQFDSPESVMHRAIEIARQGIGYVEPNPPVGAVIVDDQRRLISEGYHSKFGEPHAEAAALQTAGSRAAGSTVFVTLEPCQHQGKTPPCAQALIDAGVNKVIVGIADPASHTSGQGIQRLINAGINVEIGLLHKQCDRLIAPFRTLQTLGRPWVHAKWAMTLDGKTATRTGDSKWISSEESRAIVHQIRGRMDGIIVGSGTATADDPLLTARPPGPRIPVRIVLDSRAGLSLDSQLARTANDVPVLLFCRPDADAKRMEQLQQAGIEVVAIESENQKIDVNKVLSELGRRQMTNVLLEGGGTLAGAFHDAKRIDEVHAFIAAKIVGGEQSQTPISGGGCTSISDGPILDEPRIQVIGSDIYVNGFTC